MHHRKLLLIDLWIANVSGIERPRWGISINCLHLQWFPSATPGYGRFAPRGANLKYNARGLLFNSNLRDFLDGIVISFAAADDGQRR